MRSLCAIFVILLLFQTSAGAEEAAQLKPSARDKCPVCGMFVSKYPDWTAALLFRDGTQVFFDGAKDMFKYCLDLKRYAPSRNSSDIATVRVTDYYTLAPIDGREAYYVIGSDVFGPMGRELIPFAKQSDAKEFLKDHKGKGILRFKEVTHDVVKGLDS